MRYQSRVSLRRRSTVPFDLPGSDPTKNQVLAALRLFFDALVTRHAVVLNPFASVRGIRSRLSSSRGMTVYQKSRGDIFGPQVDF